MTDQNRTYQNGRVSTHSDVQCGSANRQTSFSGRGNVQIKLPFSGHIVNKFRRHTILQLNIEGLTASKMNVLHHLAMQSEALVILLQETHINRINCLALLYNAKDAASFYSGRWNIGTNPDLAFASVGPNSRLPNRRVLEKFPRSQHRPSLITPPRFAMAVPSMPVKRWNFLKAK